MVADDHLGRQGFQTWTPQQMRTIRHARRRYEKRVPFFPGYLFISLDVERHRWRSVNSTFGVRSLIMQAERPLACPAGLVEGLQALTDGDGIYSGTAALQPGDAVRIVAGPFVDLAGTLVRIDGSERARVLLRIMHGDVAVTMDVGKLTPA
jgi:transcription antitermination factor NusG